MTKIRETHKRHTPNPFFKPGQVIDMYGLETWQYLAKDWWVRTEDNAGDGDTVDIMDDEEMASQEYTYVYDPNAVPTVKLLRVQKIVQDTVLIVPLEQDTELTPVQRLWFEEREDVDGGLDILTVTETSPETYKALLDILPNVQ